MNIAAIVAKGISRGQSFNGVNGRNKSSRKDLTLGSAPASGHRSPSPVSASCDAKRLSMADTCGQKLLPPVPDHDKDSILTA